MATLYLDRVWINRWDSGESLSAQSAPKRGRAYAMDGEVRRYAGGRDRAVTQAGRRGLFEVTLRRVSFADVQRLESWMGMPVQVRDHRGQLFVGVFFEVPAVEYPDDRDRYDVPLAVRTVTVAGRV